jgi:hypothetical protein
LKPPAVPSPFTGRVNAHVGVGDLQTAAFADRTDDPQHRGLRRTTFLVLVEHEKHRAPVRGVGVVEKRHAGDRERFGHARHAAGEPIDAVEHFAGPLHAGPVRELDRDDQVALILERHESLRIPGERPPRHQHQHEIGQHHQPVVADDRRHTPCIAVADRIEDAVEEPEDRPQEGVEQPLDRIGR